MVLCLANETLISTFCYLLFPLSASHALLQQIILSWLGKKANDFIKKHPKGKDKDKTTIKSTKVKFSYRVFKQNRNFTCSPS